MKWLLTSVLLMACAGAKAGTVNGNSTASIFIDYVSGNDSTGDGSQGNPIKRHPFMQGFSGTYIHAVGDHFYFKRGVTWPSSCFALVLGPYSGILGNSDYYGTNSAWGAGPYAIFDDQGTPNGGFYWNPSYTNSHAMIRGIEFTGFHMTAAQNNGSAYIFMGNLNTDAQDIQVVDCLFTNVTYDPANTGCQDEFAAIYGSTTTPNTGCFSSNCIFNFNRTNSVGKVVYCFPAVIDCQISNVVSAFLGNGNPAVFAGNKLGPLGQSFSGTHGAAFEPQGAVGSQYCYGNIFSGTPEVCINIGGAAGPTGEAWIYNNIIYNTSVVILLKYAAGAANKAHIWNNVIDVSSAPNYAILSEGGTWTTVDAQNNIVIGLPGFSITSSGGTISPNIFWSLTTANANGFNSATLYYNPSSSSFVSGGTSAPSSVFTKDFKGQNYSSWTFGPYAYSSTPPPPPSYVTIKSVVAGANPPIHIHARPAGTPRTIAIESVQ